MGGSDWMGGLHGWKVPWFAPQKYERWYLYSLKGLVTSNDVFFWGNDSSGRLDLHFAKRFTEMDVQHNLLAPGNGSTDSWHQKGGKVVGMCLVWKILASIIFCSQADQSSCEDNIHMIYIYMFLSRTNFKMPSTNVDVFIYCKDRNFRLTSCGLVSSWHIHCVIYIYTCAGMYVRHIYLWMQYVLWVVVPSITGCVWVAIASWVES